MRGCSRDHYEDVFGDGLLDSDQEDIADDLDRLDDQAGNPGVHALGMDQERQRQENHEDQCEGRLVSVSGMANKFQDPGLTMVITCEMAVFEIPRS